MEDFRTIHARQVALRGRPAVGTESQLTARTPLSLTIQEPTLFTLQNAFRQVVKEGTLATKENMKEVFGELAAKIESLTEAVNGNFTDVAALFSDLEEKIHARIIESQKNIEKQVAERTDEAIQEVKKDGEKTRYEMRKLSRTTTKMLLRAFSLAMGPIITYNTSSSWAGAMGVAAILSVVQNLSHETLDFIGDLINRDYHEISKKVLKIK